MTTSTPVCPVCQGADFELRLIRDEGVAAVRCLKCSSHYLLLDSDDYWFDVIQKGYPRPARCSCKAESFRLSIHYAFRHSGDVSHIDVSSICSACGRARRQLAVDIDYGPTGHLVERPLVPVKNPRVLYDLKDLNLLVTAEDIARVVDHLGDDAKCSFLFYVRSGDQWVPRVEDTAAAKATIVSGRYFFGYAMPQRMEIPGHQAHAAKEEDAFWKHAEVVRIGSRSHVCTLGGAGRGPGSICYRGDLPAHPDIELGLSFDVRFSNEFVAGEQIVAKSASFRTVTSGLLAMLRREFVCWRGPECFDNPQVNVGIFGDRFQKKAAARRRD